MTPLTAILADDEPVLLDELHALLADAWPELQIVGLARHGTEAFRLMSTLQPDLAFLDIRMPGIDGLSLARLRPPGTRLVFVTAHADHALEAFDCGAVDYLRKPLTPQRLATTVQRLQSQVAASPRALRFVQAWVGQHLRMMAVDQIASLRSDQRYTCATSRQGEQLLLRTSLAELLPQLDPTLFWPIHRGTVIQVSAIERVARSEDGDLQVHLQGHDQALAVSRSHRVRFRGM